MNGESLPLSRTTSRTHWYRALPVALTLLASSAGVLPADEVYKSVDSEGHVVFSDQPPEGSTAQRYAVRTGDSEAPPQVIHFCWTNCFTLDFDNGLYRRADGSDETWTVERFTSTSVVLRRHDAPAAWNGFSADVVYEGQVSNGRLINITIAGKPASGVDAAWGIALNTLPGSNAERDQGNSAASAMPNLPATSSPALADGEPAVDGDMRATEAPPPLANDEQPPCPTEGYLWTPGYWAWGVAGRYYWVPGVWVPPPRVGVLWTPGYWQFVGAVYVFHPGYWGPHVGYYGGIRYGFGYMGVGFAGGRWMGNSLAYNSAVNNLNVNVIRNTYSETVASNVTDNRVSFNGGPGGTTAAPTPQERAAAADPHIPETPLQRQSMLQAANDSALVAKANVAHPAVSVLHRPTVSHVPRAAGTQGTAVRTATAPSTGESPDLSPVPANARARAKSAGGQPAAAKPTGATANQHPRP
jgi:Domain of unknown function (DUF4124)/WXXGXW repeat (2 copies)